MRLSLSAKDSPEAPCATGKHEWHMSPWWRSFARAPLSRPSATFFHVASGVLRHVYLAHAAFTAYTAAGAIAA